MYNIENFINEYNEGYKFDIEKSKIYVDLIMNEIKCILEQEIDKSYDNISLYSVCKYFESYNSYIFGKKIPCCNSNFIAEIDNTIIRFIDTKYCPCNWGYFDLRYFIDDSEAYKVKKGDYNYIGRAISSNGNVRELIISSQEEIFRKVFVRIADLPQENQKDFYKIRKNELDMDIKKLIDQKEITTIPKNKINFLKVVEKGLSKEENTNREEISLYLIFKCLVEKYEKFLENKKLQIQGIQNILSVKYSDLPIIITDLYFENNEIKLKLDYYKNYYKEISFKKNETVLKVLNEPLDINYINEILKQKLLNLYSGDFIKFYLCEDKEEIKSVNSPFTIDINKYGFKIYFKNGINDFKLNYSVLNKENNVSKDFNLLKYQYDLLEEEILKNIYIKIEDAPIWMIDDLYDLRKKSLNDSVLERIKRFFK